MQNEMAAQVTLRKGSGGSEYWEASVSLPLKNLGPTRVLKSDGSAQFSTRSAAVQAVYSVAKKLGYTANFDAPVVVKKAAKKCCQKKSTCNQPC